MICKSITYIVNLIEITVLQVLVFLARRNPEFAEELFFNGLPEMLLACVLDVSKPVPSEASHSGSRAEDLLGLFWLANPGDPRKYENFFKAIIQKRN